MPSTSQPKVSFVINGASNSLRTIHQNEEIVLKQETLINKNNQNKSRYAVLTSVRLLLFYSKESFMKQQNSQSIYPLLTSLITRCKNEIAICFPLSVTDAQKYQNHDSVVQGGVPMIIKKLTFENETIALVWISEILRVQEELLTRLQKERTESLKAQENCFTMLKKVFSDLFRACLGPTVRQSLKISMEFRKSKMYQFLTVATENEEIIEPQLKEIMEEEYKYQNKISLQQSSQEVITKQNQGKSSYQQAIKQQDPKNNKSGQSQPKKYKTIKDIAQRMDQTTLGSKINNHQDVQVSFGKEPEDQSYLENNRNLVQETLFILAEEYEARKVEKIYKYKKQRMSFEFSSQTLNMQTATTERLFELFYAFVSEQEANSVPPEVTQALMLEALAETDIFLIRLCQNLFDNIKKQDNKKRPKTVYIVLSNILSNDISMYISYLEQFKERYPIIFEFQRGEDKEEILINYELIRCQAKLSMIENWRINEKNGILFQSITDQL